jgi:hypothetical protein
MSVCLGVRILAFGISIIYLKMIVFWDAAPCSLVETGRQFINAYCLQHQGHPPTALTTESVSTSEMSVNFYQTTLRSITEDSNFFTSHRKKLISHQLYIPLILAPSVGESASVGLRYGKAAHASRDKRG